MKLLHFTIPILLLTAATSVAETDARDTIEERAEGSPAGYVLGPADVVQVFVWKEPDLSTTATVRPDGRIALPLAGELEAEGRTPEELQEQIGGRLKKFIDVPVVTVMVKEIRSPKVAVLGEVRHPGRHLVPQRITVLDAIAMSGGFTEFAKRGKVVILRPKGDGTQRIPVDVDDLLKDGGGPVYLQPGDTVYVE